MPLVSQTPAVAISIGYRLAPEHPLPCTPRLLGCVPVDRLSRVRSAGANLAHYIAVQAGINNSSLGCLRVLIVVAEKDRLKPRGIEYKEALEESKWEGKVEFMENVGEDHCFHVFDQSSENAKELYHTMISFIKQNVSEQHDVHQTIDQLRELADLVSSLLLVTRFLSHLFIKGGDACTKKYFSGL
ncbi:hypothetical protein QVD17_14523 [Tagetes erecta]|uniref:Alpha/beta hydrolase fold-3 domain-containing protein n=1 Tax=Tagetes erecta TaxID=13708 RepID=A0AAD8P418_TARER|nr:hypothetical protein QVD17_14523 [Tagetes erecta]